MSQLTESSGYELEVSGDIYRIKSLLEKIQGVSKITIQDKESLKDDQLNRYLVHLTANLNIELGRDIAALIVNQGLNLYEMRRTRPTLEDVFLNLLTEESEVVNDQ